MTSPLLLPVLSFICGLVFSSRFDGGFSAIPIIITALLLISGWLIFFIGKEKLVFPIILAGFFLSGFSLFSLSSAAYQKNSLRELPADVYLDFRGRVLNLPERRPDRELITIRVEQVEVSGEIKKIKGNLRLTVSRSSDNQKRLELLAGDLVEFSAAISQEESFRNFFPDFWPRYLRSHQIQVRGYCKSPLLVKKLNEKNLTPGAFFSGLRRKLQKSIEEDFTGNEPGSLSTEGAVLEALLLGADGRLSPETDHLFQKSGLYHLLAISGAHVAVVGFLFYSLLGLFILRRKTIQLALLLALIFYAFLVEGQPSVFRAVIMASIFLLGKLSSLETNLLNTLALSALFLLVMNPFSLEDAGFQLTFAATLSLILFYRPVINFIPRLPLKISDLLAMSVAATAGTMPIIISSFNRVTFSGWLLTVPESPLMGVIMGTGYLYLAINSTLPAVGRLLAAVLKLLIKLFFLIAGSLEPLGLLSYRIPSPPLWVVTGFYCSLLLMLLKPRWRWQKPLNAAVLLAFFLLMITHPFPPRQKKFAVTFMDVGQGDAIVVEFPGSRLMVVDGGGFPLSNFDPGENIISRFLWHRGYRKIDYLVCTHFHPDHAGGLPSLARNFKVGEFWYVEEKSNPLQPKILQALGKRTRRRIMLWGLEEKIDDYLLQVIYPDKEALSRFRPGNDLSAVLKLQGPDVSMLLAADITIPVEEYLLARRPELLPAKIIKVPHHGSRTSGGMSFLRAVSPEWAVITAGRNNIFGFPDREVLERLKAVGTEIFRIDLDGAVRFEKTAGGWLILKAAGDRNSKY